MVMSSYRLKENFGCGMIKITLEIGHKTRKQTDWQFDQVVTTERDQTYFLYDFEASQWITTSAKRSDWQDRSIAKDELIKKAIINIRKFNQYKNNIWFRTSNPYDKTDYINLDGCKRQMRPLPLDCSPQAWKKCDLYSFAPFFH